MLNAFLTAVGYRQKWHVCWVATIPGRAISYGDGTFTFTPRLTAASISDLRNELACRTSEIAECHITAGQINITGLIRVAT